jgi:hypothetical protein
MPKFHFEIVDGYTLEDPTGLELASEQNARSFADEIAKQIARDVDDPQLRVVLVKTDGGDIVHKVPIKPSR